MTLAAFDPRAYDPAACQAQAARFSTAAFRHNLTNYLDEVLAASVMVTGLPPAPEQAEQVAAGQV